MSLKFYTDTHVPKQVSIQLKERGIDIVRCEEVGLAEADDETHLEYASAEGRILITKDDDFLRLHSRWNDENRQHAGIFFSPRRNIADIGIIVKTCIEFNQIILNGVGEIKDIQNKIIFI